MTDSYDDLLEALPDELLSVQERAYAERRTLADRNPDLEFIVSDLDRWPSSMDVTVAFLGGDTSLHQMIAETAEEINEVCGINLNFGFGLTSREYRRWTESDVEYAADIRIGFDMPGYWSLVGTASIDRTLSPIDSRAGGAPSQRSLNLGGFDKELPRGWRRTVLHELLHALAFKHAHQNPRGPCQDEFRWEDDLDYEYTTNASGRVVSDRDNRRPGIYSYLGGAPNFWSRAQIDHNLRSDPSDGVTSDFDAESIMLYRFDPLFYRTFPSPCAPTTEGDSLSSGDVRGLKLLYPHTGTFDLRRAASARAALSEFQELESAATIGIEHVLKRLARESGVS